MTIADESDKLGSFSCESILKDTSYFGAQLLSGSDECSPLVTATFLPVDRGSKSQLAERETKAAHMRSFRDETQWRCPGGFPVLSSVLKPGHTSVFASMRCSFILIINSPLWPKLASVGFCYLQLESPTTTSETKIASLKEQSGHTL